MNKPAKPTRLKHVPVRLRVTVDPGAWTETGRELEDAVRDYVVAHLRDVPLVVSVRRDQL